MRNFAGSLRQIMRTAFITAFVICACSACSSSPGEEPGGQALFSAEGVSAQDGDSQAAEGVSAQDGDSQTSERAVLLEQEAFTDLSAPENNREADGIVIRRGGTPLAYERSQNTYYLPAKAGADPADLFLSMYAEEDQVIYIEEDAYIHNAADAMREGHAFQIMICSGDDRAGASLVMTGLPTVSIASKEGEIEDKTERSSTICVSAPESSMSGEWLCGARIRGASSTLLDKKSYRVELHKENGDNKKVSLLGMRKDDDWILNALFSDRTLAREKVCYRLWQDVNSLSKEPVAGSRMEYVELFVDGEYMGVYGLMEPVDGKQLGLTVGDILYKIQNWRDETEVEGQFTDHNGQPELINTKGIAYAKIEYPGDDPEYYRWDLLEAYEEFVLNKPDPTILTEAGIGLDTDNYIDHNLFCVMTHAEDNTWKNLLIACRRQKDGTYTFYETIWDLNYTFGDTFKYDTDRRNVLFDAGTTQSMRLRRDKDFAYCALEKAYPEVTAMSADRWKLWRDSGISAEYIVSLLQDCREELTAAGAMDREERRWEKSALSGDYDETCAWIGERFEFLDDFYGYDRR